MGKLSFLELLPAELLLRILHYLKATDLSSMALVSRGMRQHATDPDLWKNKGMCIRKSKVKVSGLAFLSLGRFSKLTTINLGKEILGDNLVLYLDQLRTLCTYIIGSNSVKHLNISCQNNLARLPVELLSKAVIKLVSADLSETDVNTEQLTGILTSMTLPCSLKKLHLAGVDLNSLPPDLVSDSISTLTSANLRNTNLNTEQLIPLFVKIANSTTLQNLDVSFVTLSGVPYDILVDGVKKMKELKLFACELTTIQSTDMLKSLANSTAIEHLNLGEVDLRKVPEDILAKGAMAPNMQVVNLEGTDLTDRQIKRLLELVITHKPIQELNLNRIDAIVPKSLMTNARKNIGHFISWIQGSDAKL